MQKRTWVSGILSVAALSVASSVSHAQVMSEMNVYAGANVAFLNASREWLGVFEDEGSVMSIHGRLGTFINPNLSAELRLGAGLGDDNIEFNGQDSSIQVGNYYGIYARGGLPVTDMFYPYAVIGYTRATTEIDILGTGEGPTSTVDDISYGIGTDIRFGQGFAANLEYIVLLDADTEISGFTVGLSKTF